MCYECRMMGAGPFLCIKDRKVWKGHHSCPTCGEAGIKMGYKWRAPRLTNRQAWARIRAGDYLWELPKQYLDDKSKKLNLAKKKPEGFGRYVPLEWRRKFGRA